MEEELKQLREEVEKLKQDFNAINSSTLIPVNVETAIKDRLSLLSGINGTVAGLYSGTTLVVTGAIPVNFKGSTYAIIYQ